MSKETDVELVNRLSDLKNERDDLIQRKFKISAELGSARKDLKSLCDEAKETFGTSDINELKDLLIKNRKNNEALVLTFKDEVSSFKDDIVKCEQGMKSMSL